LYDRFGSAVAIPGQTIANPPMGGRMVFRETAASTGGEFLRVDFFLAPGSAIAEEHVHPHQSERFEVVRGRAAGDGRDPPLTQYYCL
jgi:hypothetical protein